MDHEPLLITLARALDREHVDYRVFGQPAADALPHSDTGHTELATIELNRRICFPDGHVHAIIHHGGLLSPDRELCRGQGAPGGEPPLAVYHRERNGLFGHRNILIVSGDTERRFLLRRRHWFGSPANVDVVPLSETSTDARHSAHADAPPGPVLLQAERSGTWRQRLRAKWLAPKELSLPVILFVLNLLADLDRRAAVAASAGAAGL